MQNVTMQLPIVWTLVTTWNAIAVAMHSCAAIVALLFVIKGLKRGKVSPLVLLAFILNAIAAIFNGAILYSYYTSVLY